MADVTKTIVINAQLKQAQQEFESFDQSVKDTEQSIESLQRDILKLQKQKAQKDPSTESYKKLNKQIQATQIRLKEERMDLKELNKERANAKKKVTEITNAQKKQQQGIMTLDKATGGFITKIKNFNSGIINAISGLSKFRIALLALGIPAIVMAVVSLTQAFKRSEEGQDKMARIMAGLSAVTNQLLDGMANLGTAIIDAFTKPQKTFEKFANGFKKFISDPIGSIKETFTGVKDAIVDVIEETNNEIDQNIKATKMLQDAHKLDRELTVERAKANDQVSKLRLEAEKRDEYTAEQRIALLTQAQQIEEDITNKEIESAQKKLDAQRLQMSLGLNTKEALDKEAELEANLLKLNSKKLRMQRLLQTQITTATNQAIADKQREVDNEIQKEQELEDFKKTVREATVLTEEEEFQLELDKINEKYETLKAQALAQFEDEQLTKDELAEIEAQLEEARQQKITDAKNQNAEEGAKKRKQIEENELNDKIKLMREEEALRQRKLKGASDLINGLQAIAELGGKKSKALAIAGIVTDQVASVSQIISSLGIANAKAVAKSPLTGGQPFVALNTIKAVSEIASGLSASKKAISNLKSNSTSPSTSSATPTGGGGGGSVPATATQVDTPQLATPSIGGASGVNQIAEALGNQPPVQAFVVANDVTTAQSLDRNIVSSSSIG